MRLLLDSKICGIDVYRTDKDGEIIIMVKKDGKIKIKKFAK